MNTATTFKPLGRCKAGVEHAEDTYVVKRKTDGAIIHLHRTITLKSYNSIVAIWDCDNQQLYLLPDWECSNTTHKQIHKFIHTYAPVLWRRYSADFARKSFKENPDYAACVQAVGYHYECEIRHDFRVR